MPIQMNDTISILLTTLNRGTLISKAIDSVLAQTYSNWELLISDDGSTDNTSAVVKKYLERDPRIKYFFHEQVGAPISRNFVAKKAEGNYLAVIDSDDWYRTDHLSVQFEFLKSHQADIVYSPVVVSGSEANAYVSHKDDRTKKIRVTDCVCAGTFVMRRQSFELLKGFKELPYAEDPDLVERALALKMKVLKNRLSTYIYNVDSPGSITKSIG
jgi:glycosyltransferase involved in cell wall biosynthesis